MAIEKFRGEYSFLSNFHKADFEFDSNIWNTAEAAYQACKTEDWDDKLKIMDMDATTAKRYGRKVKMFAGFEDHKDEFMRVIVACKFHDNPNLLRKLVDTGDVKLIEGNTWHDNYWGVCTCGRNGCGVCAIGGFVGGGVCTCSPAYEFVAWVCCGSICDSC